MVKAGMALVLLLMGSYAQAAIYKYIDAQGRVHYSDKPPHDQALPMKLTKQAPAADAADLAERRERAGRLSEALDEEAAEADAARKSREARDRELNRRCQRARDELAQLSQASGVYELDDKGQRRFLDQGERSRNEAELKATIERHCR